MLPASLHPVFRNRPQGIGNVDLRPLCAERFVGADASQDHQLKGISSDALGLIFPDRLDEPGYFSIGHCGEVTSHLPMFRQEMGEVSAPPRRILTGPKTSRLGVVTDG